MIGGKKLTIKTINNMSKIGKPLADRVLLKLESVSEKKSSGGIILNQTTQNIQTAEVVAVSEGFVGNNGGWIELGVEVGNKVLINNGAGQKLRFDGVDYYLVRESEILMIINE
jgi:chaperonin GroES